MAVLLVLRMMLELMAARRQVELVVARRVKQAIGRLRCQLV